MSSVIRNVVEITPKDGKVDEFKAMIAQTLARVKANEPNTLRYDFYFNEDESVCYVLEEYKDSDAVMAHLGNVGEMLGPMLEIAPMTKLLSFGDPSEEVLKAAEAFGPKIFKYYAGVTH